VTLDLYRQATIAMAIRYQRLEEPSDLAGKIFEDFSGDWKAILVERLREAGFPIAAE
jgi:hypothetical protein